MKKQHYQRNFFFTYSLPFLRRTYVFQLATLLLQVGAKNVFLGSNVYFVARQAEDKKKI